MTDLNDLIANLQKEIGANDENQNVTQFIDTGFPPLNKIISGKYDGGLPFGRLIELYGDSSSGKCLTSDTMLLTEHGMMTIDELYKHEGYLAACTSKSREHSVGLINENKKLEKTSHLVWNGRRPVKVITTASGTVIKATFNHPIRVMNERGNIVWVNAGKIKVGDYLPAMLGTMQFGSNDLTEDEATLIGYLIADGSLGYKNKVCFSNTDEQVIFTYKRIVSGMTDAEIKENVHKGSRDFYIHKQSFRKMLYEKYGLDYVKSANKEVPLCVRMANRDATAAFLRAYFELECYVTKKTSIEVTSASKKLLDQVKMMLLNFGIESTLRPKIAKGYDHVYWRLNISGNGYDTFLDMIGFDTDERRFEADKKGITVKHNYNLCIPYIDKDVMDLYDSCSTHNRLLIKLIGNFRDNSRTFSAETVTAVLNALTDQKNVHNEHIFTKLTNIIAKNYIYDEVVSIEDGGEVPTFDVVMPETHSFWSNGLISHNTALATQWMVQAQKMGGAAMFIDWERSFDVELAKGFGLKTDVPYWVYKQPLTWEKGNMAAISFIRTLRSAKDIFPKNVPLLVVFDSIAAAVPESVSGKNMTELSMNDSTALARVTSSTLKLMAQEAEEHNATLLYLNQVREKPGVMYGDARVCPGGKSMEFFATSRISLSKTKIVKKTSSGKDFVGQKITIKSTKSKLTKPFQECELDMTYDDNGVARFDFVGGCIDALVKLDVLEQSGSRIIFDGTSYYKGQLTEKINSLGGMDYIKKLIP